MKYIDIHAHLNFAAFDADREEVVKRTKDLDMTVINVGTQADTSKSAIQLAEKYDNMYAVIGLHPVHTGESHHDKQEFGDKGKEFVTHGEEFDKQAYLELAKHPKVVAIGECGLDYLHSDENDSAKQVEAFEKMIDLANEVDKPLMLHIRSGKGRSAYLDAYEILKKRAKVKGNLHFFAGTVEEAKLFLELGYSFSFTGVITFARNYDEVIRYIPLDRIMSETDCPYVAPKPYRGKRNESSYAVEVVKSIAEIKGEDIEKVKTQIVENAKKFFSI